MIFNKIYYYNYLLDEILFYAVVRFLGEYKNLIYFNMQKKIVVNRLKI